MVVDDSYFDVQTTSIRRLAGHEVITDQPEGKSEPFGSSVDTRARW